ncbi:MAG TPA: TonB-dependent siderophore receptor, partial [Thauera sp.]|nr:TonB-dependent siderophore receptor [Thauera sp.]
DIGAVRLEEAYDFVSGVSRQNSFGGMWDNFSIRGFSGDINTGPNFLRNGFAGNRGFNAPRDTANVERIEVL